MIKIRTASPCSADWNRMEGNDRIRYCPECKLNVYNFSEMSDTEIHSIVAARSGRLCARFYQRIDGTMLTKNCPVGFRGALLRGMRLAGATLTTLLAMTQIKPANAQSSSNTSLVNIQSVGETLTIQVVDVSGAVITHARLSLDNNSHGNQPTWFTDEFGRVQIKDLPPGPNDIFVVATGFVVKTLHLPAQARGLYTVQLELGFMGEVVQITTGVEPEHVSIPADLSMPTQPNLPNIAKAEAHRNAFQRFFTKLRSIF